MESISKASVWAMLIYEFLGSAIVTYSYCLGGGSGHDRAFAYFIAWILAYQVSGAHFNPATTLAVFIIEREFKNLLGFLLSLLV